MWTTLISPSLLQGDSPIVFLQLSLDPADGIRQNQADAGPAWQVVGPRMTFPLAIRIPWTWFSDKGGGSPVSIRLSVFACIGTSIPSKGGLIGLIGVTEFVRVSNLLPCDVHRSILGGRLVRYPCARFLF